MTSIRGLAPGVQYVFAIAALAEGGGVERAARLPTDMYGRRKVGGTYAFIYLFIHSFLFIDLMSIFRSRCTYYVYRSLNFILLLFILSLQPVDGAFTSAFSVYTRIIATPLFDIDFGLFNANQTLNHSFIHQNNNVGPTGDFGTNYYIKAYFC